MMKFRAFTACFCARAFAACLYARAARLFRPARLPACLRAFARTALLIFAVLCLSKAAEASIAGAPPAEAPIARENIQIILPQRAITIGTNFTGADFYIAGALENADPLLRRQNRYDIILTLEGAHQNAALYEKRRHFGLWVNGAPFKFGNVPQFYALTSTRQLRDITSPQTYQNLGLSFEHLPIRSKSHLNAADAVSHIERLIDIKKQQGLYREDISGVVFGAAGLFAARFRLPDNVPVGFYTIRAYLFRDGIYSAETAAELEISRKNIAYSLYHAAQIHSFLYGLAAVLTALCIGFLGRLIFPK